MPHLIAQAFPAVMAVFAGISATSRGMEFRYRVPIGVISLWSSYSFLVSIHWL